MPAHRMPRLHHAVFFLFLYATWQEVGRWGRTTNDLPLHQIQHELVDRPSTVTMKLGRLLLSLCLCRLLPAYGSGARPLGRPSNALGSARRSGTVLPPFSIRGGAFDQHEEVYHLPWISAETMALALRWTGEVNRRLREGTRLVPTVSSPLVATPPHHSPAEVMRGGGETATSHTDNYHQPSSSLTIFHAKHPVGTGHGAARWGPPLAAFVAHLCDVLDDAEDALALALIYLDRASSLTTPRSNGAPPVPFLQPRTTHRLVLAALVWATHTTTGTPVLVLMERVAALVPDPAILWQMLEWLQAALGDPGLFVTPYTLQTWRQVLATAERVWPMATRSEALRMTAMEQQQQQQQHDTLPVITTAAAAAAATTTTSTTNHEEDQDVPPDPSGTKEESDFSEAVAEATAEDSSSLEAA